MIPIDNELNSLPRYNFSALRQFPFNTPLKAYGVFLIVDKIKLNVNSEEAVIELITFVPLRLKISMPFFIADFTSM